MSRILEGQAGVVNMIDDILVFGKTRSEHDRHLRQVMEQLAKEGVTLNREKCSFATSSVKFLGVVVSAQGICPDPDRVAAIQAMTTVSADASSNGLGSVLLQERPSGERRAVAFASRSLTPTERRYRQTEKEALVARWVVQRFQEYVRGLQFFLETDHQPLVALLGSIDVDLLPPGIQRFRLKLMRFQYQVLYVPGKLLATVDTLSHAPLDTAPSNRVNQIELFAQKVVHSFPDIVSSQHEHLRQAQANDGVCSLLLQYCANGWPRQSHLPLHVKRYWQYRGDLTVCEGLLLKGSRIVVPSPLQHRTLELLHDGHQGINRCKALAQESGAALGTHDAAKHFNSTLQKRWASIFIHSNCQDYVLLVDYRSRFPDVISLRSTSAPAVINVIKSVFARHGIPRLVRSDNGPQFAAREFYAFADSYGFRHVTNSPPFPQSNGEVERIVRTVKYLLRKADDPYLTLLAYRDTPGVNGVSPAQLLMGRRLQTRVPKTSHQLEPTWPMSVPFTRRDQDNRRRQASNFNRRHAAHALRPLQAGEQVWVRDANSPAIVIGPPQRPRSYAVETPTGVLQRNRMHLVPMTGCPAEGTTSPPGTPSAAQTTMSPTTPGADPAAQDQGTASPRESTSTADASRGSTSTPRVSKLGRKIRRPRRLDL
ncbi:uncharacterized protein LOC119458889 [Dermacentor silvarum]|uniref:uncharacterized protein LOC119458889 n=1 Tax=Dermacentor silvarum TaxID=543639 RepID=UPI00189B0569|nr:uncharacterized protein LOC119458889 [Dermacentor silvarum]